VLLLNLSRENPIKPEKHELGYALRNDADLDENAKKKPPRRRSAEGARRTRDDYLVFDALAPKF